MSEETWANTFIYCNTQEVTKWFEYENDGNPIIWPSS